MIPNISLAQMKVHSLGFDRTEAVFSIGTLPVQEKTEQIFLPKNEVFYKENDDLELFLMLFFQCYILIGKK